MKLTFDFELEDWMAFQRYHNNASRLYRRSRNTSRILFPVAMVLILTSRALGRGFEPIAWGVAAVPCILWFVFYPAWFDRRVNRRLRQHIQEGDSSTIFGTREIEFLPESIRAVSPTADTTFQKAAVSKIVETPEQLLIYVSAVQAVIVPRAKLFPEQFQQAVAYAREHYEPLG